MKSIKIYTDGACSGNPGKGGYGVVMEYGSKKKEISAAFEKTTNNRMELTAVIRTLEKDPHVTIVTDSKYVKDGVEKWIHGWKQRGWKTSTGSTVKNQDLWKHLDTLLKFDTRWEWVRGHMGDPGNEQADNLARRCAEMLKA